MCGAKRLTQKLNFLSQNKSQEVNFDVLSDSFLNGINDTYLTFHLRNVNYMRI